MNLTTIPQSIKKQIANPNPNIDQFIAVITGKVKPQKVHLAELFADVEIVQWFTENVFENKWVPRPADSKYSEQMKQHLLCEIDFWHNMGYDYMCVRGGIEFDMKLLSTEDPTKELGRGQRQWANMTDGAIKSFDDFESYDWPVVKDENVWMHEFVAENLPDGMGIFISPGNGFFENVTETLIGLESLSMMIFDQPDLVKAVFDKSREILVDMYRLAVNVPKVAGFFQGDDMGYKTGTMMSPDFLKEHVFPGHKILADIVHSKSKIYMLHSCGQLDAIMDDLIEDVKIDVKQSFEDGITPVEDFYNKYSKRIGVAGGLDVHLLASAEENVLRERCRQILNTCVPNGRYAFGSGNTITNYCKIENIMAMYDEAYKYCCWK